MKINSIKKLLAITTVTVLMCSIFVSCSNVTEKKYEVDKKIEEKVVEKEVVANKVEKDIKEEVSVDKVEPNTEENENNEVEKVDSYNQIIGIINNIYIYDNKKYIDVDEVEFFIGDKAYEEARIDGKVFKDENGNDFLPNGYYIRNNYNNIKTYEVSNSAILNLCIYIVEPSSTENSSKTLQVSNEEFEAYINDSKNLDGRSRMFWIDTKNDVVEKIEMQYTP